MQDNVKSNILFTKANDSDLSNNRLESIGGDMFIESPMLNQIDLSKNADLVTICRSSFVRHEHLQQGSVIQNNMN